VTPVSRSQEELDRRLLHTLAAKQGPKGICPKVATLAELLKVSESSVQRSRRRLEAAGLVQRLDVFESDDDPEWQRRAQAGEPAFYRGRPTRRQTRNAYRLTPGPGVTGYPQNAARDPVSAVDGDTPEGGEGSTPSKARGGRQSWLKAKAGLDRKLGRDTGVRDPLDVGRQRDPGGFDHPPSKGEVLAALQGGLGTVEILTEWPSETGPAPGTALFWIGWDWAARWQPDPVGRCSRPGCCPGRKVQWPHTLGPDGKPWHAYCWADPTPTPPKRWRTTRRKPT
jgi:hypothetical protein